MLENSQIEDRPSEPSLRLLLLLEKRLGHVAQVEGVACIVARSGPVELDRLAVERAPLFREDARKLVLRFLDPEPAAWLRRLYRIDADALRRPDIIVGSGQTTIAAGILLARLFAAPFVFSGTINGYDTGDVALQLVNSPRQAGYPRSAYVPIPSLVDPDLLRAPRRLSDASDLAGAEIALLVGGSAYRRHYRPEEWDGLERLVRDVAVRLGARWRIATSPRTPGDIADRFAEMHGRGEIAEFRDFRVAGPGSSGALLGADAIVVTEDSMSMLAEGLAAKRPVIGLASRHVNKHYANEVIAAMAAGPNLAILPIASVTAEHFAATLLRLEPPRHDSRDLIAAALASLVKQAQGVARSRNGQS